MHDPPNRDDAPAFLVVMDRLRTIIMTDLLPDAGGASAPGGAHGAAAGADDAVGGNPAPAAPVVCRQTQDRTDVLNNLLAVTEQTQTAVDRLQQMAAGTTAALCMILTSTSYESKTCNYIIMWLVHTCMLSDQAHSVCVTVEIMYKLCKGMLRCFRAAQTSAFVWVWMMDDISLML